MRAHDAAPVHEAEVRRALAQPVLVGDAGTVPDYDCCPGCRYLITGLPSDYLREVMIRVLFNSRSFSQPTRNYILQYHDIFCLKPI